MPPVASRSRRFRAAHSRFTGKSMHLHGHSSLLLRHQRNTKMTSGAYSATWKRLRRSKTLELSVAYRFGRIRLSADNVGTSPRPCD